jgi:hypothetical protein
MLHEVAAADSQSPDFDQAGQEGGGTNRNFMADCRQMDTVVADQDGAFDPAMIKSKARRDLPAPEGPRISTARGPTLTAEA